MNKEQKRENVQVATGLAAVSRMQDKQLGHGLPHAPPLPPPPGCLRCGRVVQNEEDYCGYCAAVLPRVMPAASILEPSRATPAVTHRRPATTRAARKRRLISILVPVAVLVLVLVAVAILVIHHSGWPFFVMRAAGVGSTPG